MCRQVCRKDVMERSEMESFRNACNRYIRMLHSSGMQQHQKALSWRNRIPLGCILLCDICRHFASVMLHFASLILHNLRCIPAYAHQIPTGFIQLLLNNHRDNLYIISQIIVWLGFVEFSIQIVKNTYSSLNFN